MTQIDLSNAPEGATHYGPAVEHLVANWFQFDGADYFLWDGRCWMKMSSGIQPLRKETLIALPTWNVSDLPPVGTVCERSYGGEWRKTTVCGHSPDGQSWAAFYDDDKAGWLSASGFRPIRTPAQLAAEEREKAIEFMMQMTSSLGHSDVSKKILFGELYDKGLRFEVKP